MIIQNIVGRCQQLLIICMSGQKLLELLIFLTRLLHGTVVMITMMLTACREAVMLSLAGH